MLNKRGQVTIFIIIGLVIIAGVLTFIIINNSLGNKKIPENIQPLYNDFLSCLQDKTNLGLKIVGSSGGYIFLPEAQQPTFNNPFSSELNFFGTNIPYWYYFSSGNLEKQRIPPKEQIEKQLTEFLEEKVRECNLDKYYDQGFEINQDIPKVLIKIKDNEVEANFNVNMQVNTPTDNFLIKDYSFKLRSELGNLYNSALKIYEQEQKELFLEEYAIDNLRLYAPVDGFEISCSPKTWNIYEVDSKLKQAIQENTLALTTIPPVNPNKKYFFVDLDVQENVKFFNFIDWPNYLEVNPSKGELLIANPIGNQQGLGVIGFCYVPYHFVYNLRYPVLIQVSKGEEIFQFPVLVSIKGNKPRTPLNSTAIAQPESNICKYNNTPISIRTLDSDLNLVNSSISFSCLNEECQIGQTLDGVLDANLPQCINGNLIITSSNYAKRVQTLSSVDEGQIDIILDKLYPLNVEVNIRNILSREKAILYFVSDQESKILIYPENNKINLSQGKYNVSAYIYANSSLQIPETTSQQCSDVPAKGIAGLIGITEKNCVNVKNPAQTLSSLLIGGGNSVDYYIGEQELQNSKTIAINVDELNKPYSMQDIQKNYMLVEAGSLDIKLI